MITTVKNTRGYTIFISNLLLSLLCTGIITYLGYSTGVRQRWFVQVGFAASFITSVQQIFLLTKRMAFTRVHAVHSVMAAVCMLMMICAVAVPCLFTSQFADLTGEAQVTVRNLFIVYAVNFVPMYVLFLAVFYRNSQNVQNYLHPFTEIIDGFVKSSGSIQMKEVVVDAKEKDVVLPAHKADGSSPKPSRVLKTWPKADPFPVRALYSFKPTSVSELPFKKGDTITVLDCRGRWWQAQKEDRIGFIPSNYVAVLQKARVISSFTASEDDQVSVKKDEVIEVMERYDERCLVRNVEDKIGAVPTARLDFQPDL